MTKVCAEKCETKSGQKKMVAKFGLSLSKYLSEVSDAMRVSEVRASAVMLTMASCPAKTLSVAEVPTVIYRR